jgi:hypothetical protein
MGRCVATALLFLTTYVWTTGGFGVGLLGPLFPKSCRTRGVLVVNMLQTMQRRVPTSHCTPCLAKKEGNDGKEDSGSSSAKRPEDQKKWKKNAKRILETLRRCPSFSWESCNEPCHSFHIVFLCTFLMYPFQKHAAVFLSHHTKTNPSVLLQVYLYLFT